MELGSINASCESKYANLNTVFFIWGEITADSQIICKKLVGQGGGL